MTTIRDVAKAANVSTATVSRVLNNDSKVSSATAEKVRQAIKDLNYLPNDVARSLFKGDSRMIALFVPDITNPFFPELARAVEDVANKHHYTFVLCNTDNNNEKEIAYLNALQRKSVDGFIIVSSSMKEEDIKHIQVPVVSLDRIFSPGISSVTTNNREGARQAVRYLESLGFRRIGHIAGPDNVSNARERLQGYLDEVENRDWFTPDYIVHGAYHFDVSKEVTQQLLTKHPEIDALFAGNDLMGAGVLSAAANMGLNIPGDLAVIGFDGIALGKNTTPTLTTMEQPIYKIGARAAEILIHHIVDKNQELINDQFDVQLVERQSTVKNGEEGIT